jgi:hypothetical protein
MIDGEVISIQMLMLGQVWSTIEFDARGARTPFIAKDNLVYAGKIPVEGVPRGA